MGTDRSARALGFLRKLKQPTGLRVGAPDLAAAKTS